MNRAACQDLHSLRRWRLTIADMDVNTSRVNIHLSSGLVRPVPTYDE
jgi:hypothetical protein